MSTQLRLVEAPKARKPKTRKATSRRARTVPSGRARVRWNSDWRLDATARQVGRKGVATAREALARASDTALPKAS
jgi:hypothetical protein